MQLYDLTFLGSQNLYVRTICLFIPTLTDKSTTNMKNDNIYKVLFIAEFLHV